MANQLQASSVHVLKVNYIYYSAQKTLIYKLYLSKVPKSQQICHYRHAIKPANIFLLRDTGVNISFRNNLELT